MEIYIFKESPEPIMLASKVAYKKHVVKCVFGISYTTYVEYALFSSSQ